MGPTNTNPPTDDSSLHLTTLFDSNTSSSNSSHIQDTSGGDGPPSSLAIGRSLPSTSTEHQDMIGKSKQVYKAEPVLVQDRKTDKQRIMNTLFDNVKDINKPAIMFERHLKAVVRNKKFDATVVDSDGLNLLMVAMQAKIIPAMRSIFFSGQWSVLRDHTISNPNERTHISGKGILEFATKIIKSGKVLTEVKNLDALELSLLPLHKAARDGNIDLVTNLLDHLPEEHLSLRDKDGNSALHYACINGCLGVMQLLTQAGANLDAVNHEEQNPVHLAVKHANVSVLKHLLKMKKYNLEEKDAVGKTAMMYTAHTGHTVSLSILASIGVPLDPNILSIAAQNGCLDYLRHAFQKRHMSLSFVDCHKKTILHYACVNGHSNVIDFLLKNMENITEVLTMKERAERNVLHVCCDSDIKQTLPLIKLLEVAKAQGVLDKMIDEKDLYTGLGSSVLVSGKDNGKFKLYGGYSDCSASIIMKQYYEYRASICVAI